MTDGLTIPDDARQAEPQRRSDAAESVCVLAIISHPIFPCISGHSTRLEKESESFSANSNRNALSPPCENSRIPVRLNP